jgi:hypothetical protein
MYTHRVVSFFCCMAIALSEHALHLAAELDAYYSGNDGCANN